MALFGSKTNTQQYTTNVDQRVAVQDGIGISGDGNALALTTTYNVTDGGMVTRALDTVDKSNKTLADVFGRALDTVDAGQAIQGEGFSSLLDAAENLFDRGERMVGQTQDRIADAYSMAQTDAKGTIDNRTIVVLAIAAAVGLWAISRRRA
jgi:hypothetical protein